MTVWERGAVAFRPQGWVGTRLGRIVGPRRGFARPARRPDPRTAPDGHPRRPGDPPRWERVLLAFRPRPIGFPAAISSDFYQPPLILCPKDFSIHPLFPSWALLNDKGE